MKFFFMMLAVLGSVSCYSQPVAYTEQSAPPPSLPHEELRFEFTLGGKKYEAVGFLKRDETSVTGDEMLARTDKDGMVVGEEDWKHLYKHRHELPEEVGRYYLATKRPDPDYPRFVSCLDRYRGEWYDYWNYLPVARLLSRSAPSHVASSALGVEGTWVFGPLIPRLLGHSPVLVYSCGSFLFLEK